MGSIHFSLKKGLRGRGKLHFEYITATGASRSKEDVVHVSHCNYPEWGQHNPALFWGLGDQLTRANGKVYSEFEAALPRELPLPALIELAESFAKEMLGEKHVYTVAVHAAVASDGGANPNMHVMFNERLLDDIERGSQPREQELWFRRYNAESPELGGCQVDPSWNDRECPNHLRAAWEAICNKHLANHGVDRKIDLRSNWRKGIDTPIEPKIGVGPGAEARKAAVEKIREDIHTSDLESGSLALLNGSDPIGQITCAEIDDATRVKKRILESAIQSAVSEAFAQELWFVRKGEDFTWIVFRSPPGGVKDSGPWMTAHGMPDAAAAQRLIELAKAKGWKQIRCTGEDAFIREAIRLAMSAGIEVIPENDSQGFILDSITKVARYHAATQRLPVLKETIQRLKEELEGMERQNVGAQRLDCLMPNVKTIKEATNAAARQLGGDPLNNLIDQYHEAHRQKEAAAFALEQAPGGLFNLFKKQRLESNLREATKLFKNIHQNYWTEYKKIDGKVLEQTATNFLQKSELRAKQRAEYANRRAELNDQLTRALEEQKNLDEFIMSMQEVEISENHVQRKPRPLATR